MVEVLLKYSVLIFCSFNIFLKLLNIKKQKKVYVYFLLFLLIALPIIYALRLYTVSLSIIIMVALFVFFCVKIVRVNLFLSLTTAVISFGFSYFALIIGTVLSSAPLYLFFSIKNINDFPWYTVVPACAVQILLTIIPFRFKRLKNGMPFLIEHGSGDIGFFVSVTLLIAASLLGINKNDDYIKLISVLFILISGVIVLFWWRSSLTKKYLKKIKAQEIQELQDTIDNENTEIAYLTKNNDDLSKIIHKDNKLIPALEYAVRQYLLTAESEPDSKERIAKAKILLSQIEAASYERRGIITSYEVNNKKLTSTNIPSIDSLLTYMLQKTKAHQIDFNVSVSGSVKFLVENVIEERDLNTLLADLIENAVIAIKNSSTKNVLVNIGIIDEYYSVDVFDSGITFSPEIIAKIGLNKVTTNKHEGGNGIGLMTVFEILKKYQASFEIYAIQNSTSYTKKVSVCFDSLGQFRIKSQCNKTAELLSTRTDVLLVNESGA